MGQLHFYKFSYGAISDIQISLYVFLLLLTVILSEPHEIQKQSFGGVL